MILGSHNSWTYLPPKKWWMFPFKFTAKCQDCNIIEQYNLGVRCFDLRVRFNKSKLLVAHGFFEYKIDQNLLFKQLKWLNSCENISVRILHEVRTKNFYIKESIESFQNFCSYVEKEFPSIKFWGGSNLYNQNIDYKFHYNPSCEGKYSSVSSPKWLDDWFPRIFAWRKNKEIREKGTNKEILLIDFVNYGSN